jgi:hypothetical protein
MKVRITALAALALLVPAAGVYAQDKTPSGAPNTGSGVKGFVHPPSISAPDASEPKASAPAKSSAPARAAHTRKPKRPQPDTSSAPR